MPTRLDAQLVVESLVGSTIFTPSRNKPNKVLEIKGAKAIIATEKSPDGEPVAIGQVQYGLDILLDTGKIQVTPSAFGNYRRSSAIGAILASLPGTEIVDTSPAQIRLNPSSPLRSRFEEACAMVAKPRGLPTVTSGERFHELMSQDLPEAVLLYIENGQNLKVKGSAGQMNFLWAETPWVAVLNRLVTHSAQRGHYLVFLVEANGQGVYLSLNQGVTETGAVSHGQYLFQRAEQFRGYLTNHNTDGLILEPINLPGRGNRTRSYGLANIAAIRFSSGAIPHDIVLATELQRFLDLYEATIAGLDEDVAASSFDIPEDARKGTESKHYRWHLRAEGRNSAAARRAKQLHGYACQICERDFEQELGEIGKRCIEAHHLVPFKELDSQPRDLDPEEDFAIVCANCHRMLHSETPPLSPEALAKQLV